MDYLKNIKKQYFISLFQALIPAYVIERLFSQQRGMTVQMVVYMEIVYALTITVLEIPTGILADKFGRKRLIALCNVLAVLEFVILLYSYSFWGFALAAFLAGVGNALSSGSNNALLYDSLLSAGKQDNFEKILGRLTAVEYTGHVAAALSGAVLASRFGYEFNYVLSAGSMFAACIITFTLKEPPVLTKPENESALQYAKEAVKIFKSHPLLLLYCFTGAVLGSCTIYIEEFWQIIMENINFPVVFFGLVSAAVLACRIPGNMFAYKLKEKFSYKTLLTVIIGLSSAGFVVMFFSRNVFCLIPMALLSLTAGIVEPLLAGFLHHRAESSVRATVESFSSLGLRVISAGVGLVFGYISSAYSIFAGFLALGAICFAYLIFFIVRSGEEKGIVPIK